MGSKEYVQALEEIFQNEELRHDSDYVESLIRVIHFRGHQKLLLEIIREFEDRLEGGKRVGSMTLTVAHQDDEKVLHEEIEQDKKSFDFDAFEMDTIVDESIIGGYRLEGEGLLIDRTHKKALLEMHKKMTC